MPKCASEGPSFCQVVVDYTHKQLDVMIVFWAWLIFKDGSYYLA